jgi:uncharacterized membrane-anchored protein
VSRLPAITIWFWLIKTMITAADVVWPDYLYQHLGQTLTSGLIGLAVVVTLVIQFGVRRYRAWAFWPATIAVSVAGTELANGIYDLAHLGYAWITVLYLVVLVALLVWWRAREGTLSLRRVDTARREGFYWAAALVAFAVGTALGHAVILAPAVGLVVWAVLVGCAAVARKLSPVLAFWAAYVLTRPLGTVIALALAVLGRWPVSAGFGVALIILATWTARSRRDVG